MERAHTEQGEPLWVVRFKSCTTGEIFAELFSAPTDEEATVKWRSLYGYKKAYCWNGTEAVYYELNEQAEPNGWLEERGRDMRKITQDELKVILARHKLWIESYWKEGEQADLSEADLTYTNLSNANLTRADLSDANLGGANLSGANLSNANLSNANLGGADLSYANLRDANLRGANLIGANLSGVDLIGANLSNANLTYANLTYANLTQTNLTQADLIGTNLNYSSFPLHRGSLKAGVDDRIAVQLLYHTLAVVKTSPHVSQELKDGLLTEQNIAFANRFHRAHGCRVFSGEGKA